MELKEILSFFADDKTKFIEGFKSYLAAHYGIPGEIADESCIDSELLLDYIVQYGNSRHNDALDKAAESVRILKGSGSVNPNNVVDKQSILTLKIPTK